MDSIIDIQSGFPTHPLLEKAAQFVGKRFEHNDDTRLVFHNLALVKELVRVVDILCNEEHCDKATSLTSGLAAYFIFSGYLNEYNDYGKHSIENARNFMEKEVDALDPVAQQKVISCLQTVVKKEVPLDKCSKILQDAVNVVHYMANYEEKFPLHRLERELMGDLDIDKNTYAQLSIQELLKVKLHTQAAQSLYGNKLGQSILIHKKRVEKSISKQDASPKAEEDGFGVIESGVPVRSIQTFFRSNYRNHINLSSIADNKANIMISVNSILISVVISTLTYHNWASSNPQIILPVILFLITALVSLIFAVLSARPKVTSLIKNKTDKSANKKNLIFFGNFVKLSAEEYEEAMLDVFQSSDLLYSNMVRDMYHLGKVLDKKYRYLTVSYTVFMVGFITTVTLFLITFRP